MADLIDRAALLKLFDERFDESHIQACTRQTGKTLWSGINAGVNWGRNTVIEAPAVDAVEVVRCKDCKHVESVVTPYGERWSCYAWDRYTYPDGYCQEGEFDGERRTECG